jgi:hypothetical protein
VVVGTGYQGGVQKGFIYDGTTYTPILPEGWTSASASSVNDAGVVVGWGAAGPVMKGFIAYPPTPEGQIAQVMDFFDASVAAGTLTGSSPGNSGQAQVKNLDKLLTSSSQEIAAGNDASACKDLAKAYSRADKHVKSSDSVAGAAAAELQQQIQGLMTSLSCP